MEAPELEKQAISLAATRARLNTEALRRALRIHDAWMARRDPATGLFPQSPSFREWNYRNTAADFFSFQLLLAIRTDAPSLPALRETLARERGFNPGPALCLPVDLDTGRTFSPRRPAPMFTTSEYLKDGLIGVYERTGDAAVRARIVEIAESILANCTVASRYGLIPSNDSEVNGNVLQAFSRLAYMLDDDRCAEAVGRLGDAVVMQMLAESGGLPVVRFDYGERAAGANATRGRPPRASGDVQLRDHGNETAVGMSEAFALAAERAPRDLAWRERADRWAEPLANVYELILEHGVSPDGLLMNRIEARTFKPLDPAPCDNWGYLLCGAILFCQAAERHGRVDPDRLRGILARADRIALAVAATDGLKWEPTAPHDGWADTLESAIYIAAHRPALREAMRTWVDHQIEHMYACQKPDGFASGDYLDGNFIRTALLYADLCAGGFELSPPGVGCGVGFAMDGDEPIVVVIAGKKGYTGRLVPDTPRHRERLKLPWNWARLNSWPEWVVADTEQSRAGVPISLPPGGTRIVRGSEIGALRTTDRH